MRRGPLAGRTIALAVALLSLGGVAAGAQERQRADTLDDAARRACAADSAAAVPLDRPRLLQVVMPRPQGDTARLDSQIRAPLVALAAQLGFAFECVLPGSRLVDRRHGGVYHVTDHSVGKVVLATPGMRPLFLPPTEPLAEVETRARRLLELSARR